MLRQLAIKCSCSFGSLAAFRETKAFGELWLAEGSTWSGACGLIKLNT